MVIHGNSSALNVRDTVAGSCRAGIVSVALGSAVLCHSLHSLALSIAVPLLPFSCSLFLWPPRRAGSGLPLWLSFSDGNVHPPFPVAGSSAAFPKERTRRALSHHTFGAGGALCVLEGSSGDKQLSEGAVGQWGRERSSSIWENPL